MKKSKPGNLTGLLTETNLSPALYETFDSKEMGWTFWGKLWIQVKGASH